MDDPLLRNIKRRSGDTRFNKAVAADVEPEASAQETTDRLWEILRGKEKEAVVTHLREVGWKYDPVARVRGALVFGKDKRRLLVWFGKKGTASMVGFDDRNNGNGES
ncbi:MAG: hypothetical protein L6R28_15950 [Planctomycetes bacterium]|nr:hypothetical protein [Planctomycetota bacterium]